jgi:hypothetical protein
MIWSFSDSRTFARCQRQWYFGEVVANANATKVPIRREAYLLSKLQSVSAWRGQIVDSTIGSVVVPALNRGYPPSLDECLRHALRLFDTQLAFARRHGLRDAGMKPARAGEEFAAFFEVEYCAGVPEADVARARSEVEQALTNLFRMTDLFADLTRASYSVAQRPLQFDHCGYPVKAMPDLISFFPDGPPLITDWKVHFFGAKDYRLQLATYALALTRCNPHKDFPAGATSHGPTDVRLAEAQLLTGQLRRYPLTVEDVNEVEDHIAASAEQMALALDGRKFADLCPDDFRVTIFPETCQGCRFRSLCWKETP